MDYNDCEYEARDYKEVPGNAEHAEYGSIFDERVVDRYVEVDAVKFFVVGTRLFNFLSHNSCAISETYDLCYEPEECTIGLKSAKAHKWGERTCYFVDYAITF